MTDPEPTELAEGVEVLDAFIDLTGGSRHEMQIKTSTTLSYESACPVPAEETGRLWLAENDAGVFWAFNDGSVSPPADEPDKTGTVPVEHETLGVEDRVIHYDHVTKSKQNEREPDSCLTVKVKAEDGYNTSYPMRIELAVEILEKYINGPLGTDEVAYWYHQHQSSWGRTVDRDEFEGYLTPEIVPFKDHIYTWKFKRRQDVTDDDELHEDYQ